METVQIRESAVFPTGYGDFVLQSSDGLVCHFPRYLLSHMSGFFMGMFALPEHASIKQYPLPVPESGEVLELLLHHMEPKMHPPRSNASNLVQLLEAARKYEVPMVMERFETEVYDKGEPIFGSPDSLPIVLKDPLLILYCAFEFGLPKAGQQALRVLVQCERRLLQTTSPISLQVYLHAIELREARKKLFHNFVSSLVKKQRSTTTTRGFFGEDQKIVTKDVNSMFCASCTAKRAAWVRTITRSIEAHPKWTSFIESFKSSSQGCTTKKCDSKPLSEYFNHDLEEWERKALEAEKTLPEWPFYKA